MWQIIRGVLTGQNQFASGGMLLMIIGGLGVYLRAVPERRLAMVRRPNHDDDHRKGRRCGIRVGEGMVSGTEFPDANSQSGSRHHHAGERVALIPAPGRHWFWYGGRPFVVYFYRSEESRERITRRIEALTFRTVGRQRAVLQRFVDDVVACHIKRLGVQSSLFTYNDGWDFVEGYAPRLLESVILQPGEKEHLVQDIETSRNHDSDTSVWAFPTIAAICFMGLPGPARHPWYPRWRRISGCRFIRSILPISTTEL